MRKVYTPATAAVGVEEVLKLLEGRWKLIILFHLFDGKVVEERQLSAVS